MKRPTFCKQYVAEPKWWSFLTLRAEIVSSINWCFQFHFCPAPIQSTPRSHYNFWNTQQSNHIVFLLKTSQDWELLGFFSGHEDLEKASGSSICHAKGYAKFTFMALNPSGVKEKTYLWPGIKPICLSLYCLTQNIQLAIKIMRHIKRQQGTTYCQKIKQSMQPHPDTTLMLGLPEREFKITMINALRAPKYTY